MDGGKRDEGTYAIIGAAMEVHREKGCGFHEPVCQECLAIELEDRAIPFSREPELPVHYKGQRLTCTYRPDFICYETVLVELKALPALTNNEHAQIINYLKAWGLSVGLLINFGAKSLEYKRFIHTEGQNKKSE